MKKIALFTIAVGTDRIYFDSVKRYLPYNRKYFGQKYDMDFYLFTDRSETIEGVINIPCKTSAWPYTTLLKNNIIADYLDGENKWKEYDNIFFIDADFAIGKEYDFFSHNFLLVEPYWNHNNGGGFFYGGKTEYFKKLSSLFYDELDFIYENKLSVPKDLDEYYLGLFRMEYKNEIHIIAMNTETNTLIFYDNENLDEKMQLQGNRIFLQPYKAEGRANKAMIVNYPAQRMMECIVNLDEKYIFDNYTYDYGRLLKIDNKRYRILWSKNPELREVLNIESNNIKNCPI